jgi:hypothetical protein
MLHKELRDMRELGVATAGAPLPAHLAGLPECLHKYGPLFEQLAAQQEPAPEQASVA